MSDYDMNCGWIACRAALELEKYRAGKSTDLTYFDKVREGLAEHQLGSYPRPTVLNSDFPYIALVKVAAKDSNKPKLQGLSELALEMRLMRYALDSAFDSPEKMQQAISILNDISREFRIEDEIRYPSRRDLVA